MLWSPAGANAHGKAPTVAADYVAVPTSVDGSVSGVTAEVLGSTQRLRLQTPAGHVLVVLGYVDEPFLRFSATGVEVNDGSATAQGLRLARVPAVAQPAGGVAWHRVSGGHSYAWHDERLRPRIDINGAGQAERQAAWSIPILVDGRRTEIRGELRYRAGPVIWPWLGVAALTLAALGLLAALCDRRVKRLAGQALAIVSSVAAALSLIGLFAYQQSAARTWFAFVWGAIMAAFASGVVVGVPPTARHLAVVAVGAVAVFASLAMLGVFRHGFVLSVLPAGVARGTVAVSLLAGLGCMILIPAVANRQPPGASGARSWKAAR